MTPASVSSPSVFSVAPQRRWRLQYSLRTLVLLTITAGALLMFGMSYRETLALRKETKRLRDAVGELTITDPGKVHIIAGKTLDNDTWRWRVYCPSKRQFIASFQFTNPVFSEAKVREILEMREQGKISEEEWERYVVGRAEECWKRHSVLLDSGEQTLTAYLGRSQAGKWRFALEYKGYKRCDVEVPMPLQKLLDRPDIGPDSSSSEFGKVGTVSADQGEEVNLLFMAWSDQDNGSPRSPACKLRIWIEEDKPAKGTKP